jgi:hypothetical protein
MGDDGSRGPLMTAELTIAESMIAATVSVEKHSFLEI